MRGSATESTLSPPTRLVLAGDVAPGNRNPEKGFFKSAESPRGDGAVGSCLLVETHPGEPVCGKWPWRRRPGGVHGRDELPKNVLRWFRFSQDPSQIRPASSWRPIKRAAVRRASASPAAGRTRCDRASVLPSWNTMILQVKSNKATDASCADGGGDSQTRTEVTASGKTVGRTRIQQTAHRRRSREQARQREEEIRRQPPAPAVERSDDGPFPGLWKQKHPGNTGGVRRSGLGML